MTDTARRILIDWLVKSGELQPGFSYHDEDLSAALADHDNRVEAVLQANAIERDTLRAQVQELNLLVAEAKGQLEDLDLRNNRYRDLCKEMVGALEQIAKFQTSGEMPVAEYMNKSFGNAWKYAPNEMIVIARNALSHAKELGVEP